MYYSMHNANRFLPPRFTPAQSKLIDQGIDGMEKLWTMYNNDKIWNVEKTLVNMKLLYIVVGSSNVLKTIWVFLCNYNAIFTDLYCTVFFLKIF